MAFLFPCCGEMLPQKVGLMTTQLKVTNLNVETTENDLYGIFNRTGLVLTIKVNEQVRGSNTGTATVDMSSPESAQNAIKMLHGSTLLDRQIAVNVA
jgi:RNA recognition motif-containing protein